jgi:hypothetical protein
VTWHVLWRGCGRERGGRHDIDTHGRPDGPALPMIPLVYRWPKAVRMFKVLAVRAHTYLPGAVGPGPC